MRPSVETPGVNPPLMPPTDDTPRADAPSIMVTVVTPGAKHNKNCVSICRTVPSTSCGNSSRSLCWIVVPSDACSVSREISGAFTSTVSRALPTVITTFVVEFAAACTNTFFWTEDLNPALLYRNCISAWIQISEVITSHRTSRSVPANSSICVGNCDFSVGNRQPGLIGHGALNSAECLRMQSWSGRDQQNEGPETGGQPRQRPERTLLYSQDKHARVRLCERAGTAHTATSAL